MAAASQIDDSVREAITLLLAGQQPPETDYGPIYAPVIVNLRRALETGNIEVVKNRLAMLRQFTPGLADLMREPEPPAPACPALPEGVAIDPALGADACKWLDEYITWSRKWAPRAYDAMHELSGLFVLSTIAARRVYIPLGRGQYTNLTLMHCARTTVYGKSTVAELARDAIRAVGLGQLLGPDKTTPEKMIADMAGKIDLSDYGRMSLDEQEKIRRRLAFSGQRGWYAEEFGTHLKAMQQENGHYAALYGLMMVADDCKSEYVQSTIGGGERRVENPYLTTLGCMTPANLKSAAKRGTDIWQDGFFARFGFSTPDCPPTQGRFPEEIYLGTPDAISDPLHRWHADLGIPEVTIEETIDEKGKHTGRYTWTRDDLPRQTCLIDKDVFDAFYRYGDALIALQTASGNEDLDGNYGRFPTMALRIAGLFASLENDGRIQMRHWARAQAITERMRSALHALIEQVNTDVTPTREAQQEDKIIDAFVSAKRAGKDATTRELGRRAHLSSGQAQTILNSLEIAGVVHKISRGKTQIYQLDSSSDSEVSPVTPVASVTTT